MVENVISEESCNEASVTFNKLPVVDGKVGNVDVKVLRDTGCSSIVVNERLVKPHQYLGGHAYMTLINGSKVEVPKVKIFVQTPFLSGEVKAYAMKDCLFDLVIGNEEGVNDKVGIEEWKDVCAVTTRSQIKQSSLSPLKIREISDVTVDRDQLIKLQSADPTLARYFDRCCDAQESQAVWFNLCNGVLYRFYKLFNGSISKQVVVPQSLRSRVMSQAHDSLLGGHLGITKTKDRILSSFHWPGIHGDVSRFCQSCDVCQKTVLKSCVSKVPLQKMPLIDTPFKRVAVDLIGPIHPPSEAGHRYILTLVDYATRYPEAVALKDINTESVAEALVDFFCRLGVPDEILSDQGTQFVSQCMREVTRLLSIKQLTTTPYHPMCNGLVEKFNGTLKQMLRRLCSEQPKQWHRFISALLFAYREVPQESTGFSPFELLYGRTVRGPMQILKRMWTSENENPETLNTYQYVFELRERLEDTLQVAKDNLEKAQNKYKHYYDKRSRPRSFVVDDQVLVLLPTDHNKLLMQWKGPFKVTEKVGLNDYAVEIKGKRKVFHVNLLKKYWSKTEESDMAVCGVLDVVCSAYVEAEETEVVEEFFDEVDVPEVGSYMPKESVADVKFGGQLEGDELNQAKELVQKFDSVFTEQPGTCNLIEHEINLNSHNAVRSRPYVVPFAVRESLKKDINDMLEMGVIRRSRSSYASPVVIVRKPDGSNRVCIDYRKLNRITQFDPEPMVSISELFHKLGHAKYFSKVDLSKGYWQIPVTERDIPKTAFVTPDGTYEFLKMPFGMMNSGATLMRAIRKMIDGMSCVANYVDDILVYTDDLKSHLEILNELFLRMKAAGFTARPSKCLIASSQVEFVGHMLLPGLTTPQESNLIKVREAGRPKTKKEIRSFLGLVGFYSDYVPQFATISAPLTDLIKKGQPNVVNWNPAAEKAFNELKERVLSKPILRLPDSQKPFILQTDASEVGIGAVLLQEFEGRLFPVSFASRKLLPREQKYSTIERECLGLVWAVKKFNPYLYGTQFVLQTDHQPLTYLHQAKYINDRVMRWAMVLQSYSMTIQTIKGKDNHGADFLSRSI
jgi:transposase InsO family protein